MNVAYIEVIIPFNALLTLVLLYASGRVLGEQGGVLRCILVSLLSSVVSIPALFIQSIWVGLLYRFILSSLMVLLAWKWRGIRVLLRRWIVLVCATALSGGIALALEMFTAGAVGDVGAFIGAVGVLLASLGVSHVMGKRGERVRYSFTFHTRIYFEAKTMECYAMLDTGNALREPISGLPVVLINQVDFEPHGQGPLRTIPYRAVGSSGEMPACLAQKCEIYIQGKWHNAGEVYVARGAFIQENTVEALLPLSILQ